MQLKTEGSAARRRLVVASCALLGATAARAQQAADGGGSVDSGEVVVDSALAYYHENGRVTAIEPVVNLRRDNGDGSVYSLNVVFDSLSGSSPNGALTSNKPQTFASPSGSSLSAAPQTYTTASGQVSYSSAPIYTVAPGQLPADPNYHDQRLAVGGAWQWPASRLQRLRIGGTVSYEHDFLSLSGNAGLERDFNDKNTTVSVGVNDEIDAVRPIGGAPVPGSDYTLFQKAGSKHKNGVGALLGITQIMNRRWIAQFNLTADRFTGYLNDPYKILSIIDSAGNTTGYLNESRPDARLRRSAYLENRLAWSRVSAGVALRYMSDDWKVHSTTVETNLKWWDSDRDRYLQPTFRWYRQSAAQLFAPWIWAGSGQSIQYASADERLGAFHALTYGLKYAMKFDGGGDSGAGSSSEFSIRLQYYQQIAEHRPPAPILLQGLDLFPPLKAVMLQVGYRFGY